MYHGYKKRLQVLFSDNNVVCVKTVLLNASWTSPKLAFHILAHPTTN